MTLAVTKQGDRQLPQRERPQVTVPIDASLDDVVFSFCVNWLEDYFEDEGGAHDDHLVSEAVLVVTSEVVHVGSHDFSKRDTSGTGITIE